MANQSTCRFPARHAAAEFRLRRVQKARARAIAARRSGGFDRLVESGPDAAAQSQGVLLPSASGEARSAGARERSLRARPRVAQEPVVRRRRDEREDAVEPGAHHARHRARLHHATTPLDRSPQLLGA